MSKYILNDTIDLQPLISTRDFLAEALEKDQDKFRIAGAIQAFEVCYELAWKTGKKVLSFYGIEVNNPRDVFRLIAEKGLIDDPKSWFDYLKKRNITVHEYQEAIMEKVYPVLPRFLQNLDLLIEKLKKL
jgi:nucleotidyltransferase substrate binding protein (TIGR01987 family)